MITKEMAIELRPGTELWHSTSKNADGSPLRARVNGACKTWKTRPLAWKLPMKHGMRDCFYIGTDGDCVEGKYWSLPERWPIEQHWKDG